MPRTSQWPAVDRAADLYLECHQVADGSDGDSSTSVLEGVTAAELSSLLNTNETAAELVTRLASRYQDGVLFWLDAAGRRPDRRSAYFSDVDSQAKVSVFLTHLKNFVVTAVSGAKWLSPMQQELMIKRLFKFEFTRGVPARKNGVALLNRQYAYLPATTGDFAHDFDEAAHVARNTSLRHASAPLFPPALGVS
ncbi:hypothetical protein MTO96_037120 [Rhipicephalus appendiculatus]